MFRKLIHSIFRDMDDCFYRVSVRRFSAQPERIYKKFPNKNVSCKNRICRHCCGLALFAQPFSPPRRTLPRCRSDAIYKLRKNIFLLIRNLIHFLHHHGKNKREDTLHSSLRKKIFPISYPYKAVLRQEKLPPRQLDRQLKLP